MIKKTNLINIKASKIILINFMMIFQNYKKKIRNGNQNLKKFAFLYEPRTSTKKKFN